MAKFAEALAGLVHAMNREIHTDYDKQLQRDDALECLDSLLVAPVGSLDQMQTVDGLVALLRNLSGG